MIYAFSIATPANTAEAAKQRTVLTITKGIVHQFEVFFPPGCVGLVHLQIFNALQQILPSGQGSSFIGDGTTLAYREFIELVEPPYQLTAYTWNLDDTYAHTITLRLGILPERILAPWQMSFTDRLRALLGG